MFVVLRSGLAAKLSISGVAKELCKVPKTISKYQVATLTRAAYRDEDEVPNIKPFPYHVKEVNLFNLFMDTHKNRVHKHSKLIVVDGQVAAGKTKLAMELAKEFDFLYLPQPTFDDLYIDYWGFDVRTMDDKLPNSMKSWDIERFLQCPDNENNLSMQLYMYLLRQDRYMDALAHVFCTGQGVVTVRSPWTDTVFAKAMRQNGYLSAGGLEAHTDCCLASLHFYLKPHLIIYLDVPVDITQQNIKKRGLCHEVNSKVLNEKYLGDIEESYKRDYLSKLGKHSHLLIYDWSQGGDIEIVVEDIENLNFDNFDDNDPKLEDWRFGGYQHKLFMRNYTFHKDMYLCNMDIFRTDVPELNCTGNDWEVWYNAWHSLDDARYAAGYNPLKGDKGVLWKHHDVKYYKDYVTPLMEKYYERKKRAKSGGQKSK